jgi:type IV pilus assembly protein PilC
MSVFQYAARNSQGNVVNGNVEAPNEAAAVRQLRAEGLMLTQIQEMAASGGTTARKPKESGKSGKIRLDDLVVFSRQFATMIRAGLPLIEVLGILSGQTEKVALKVVLREVEKDVEAGASLTEALEKHPTVFSTFFKSMVRAGEAAGMLASILDQVAGYLEKTASLQRKVKSAVMYPTTVAFAATVITIFLLTAVVPTFKDIFSGLGGTLPLPTRIVLAASDFIKEKYVFAIISIVGAFFVFRWWYQSPRGRYRVDLIKLRMPVFGPLFLKVAVAKFSRTLSTLIRSGVNILSALDIVAATSGNQVIEEAVAKTRASIQGGETLAKPLEESGVFPVMVTRMVSVGERVGSLESMLSKIADFYEDQVDTAVDGLTSLIEPLLIIFLGCVVGFIVIAMFMPMFKMIELMGG